MKLFVINVLVAKQGGPLTGDFLFLTVGLDKEELAVKFQKQAAEAEN